VYPIEFWRLARVVILVNLVRYCSVLPLLAAAAAAIALKAQWNSATAVWIGLKVIILGLLLQPVLPVLFISPGTNDTRKPLFMISVLVLSLALIACTVACLIVEKTLLVFLADLAFGLLSLTGLFWYGWMFNHDRFDLIPAQTAQTRSGE